MSLLNPPVRAPRCRRSSHDRPACKCSRTGLSSPVYIRNSYQDGRAVTPKNIEVLRASQPSRFYVYGQNLPGLLPSGYIISDFYVLTSPFGESKRMGSSRKRVGRVGEGRKVYRNEWWQAGIFALYLAIFKYPVIWNARRNIHKYCYFFILDGLTAQ